MLSALVADEARKYGVDFEQHDDRYARTAEWLEIVDGMWKENGFSFNGKYYRVEDGTLAPKPISRPRPVIYAGGESEAAKNLIAHDAMPTCCMAIRRIGFARNFRYAVAPRKTQLATDAYGVAAYVIVRSTEEEAQKELARITNVKTSAAGFDNYQQWLSGTKLEGRCRSRNIPFPTGITFGLVGTPDQVAATIAEFEKAGVDLLLLQCSPQLEEMERFSPKSLPKQNPSEVSGKTISIVWR